MNRKIVGYLGALLLFSHGGTLLADEHVSGGAFADENFSGTFGITTNFMYRGISFSNDEPAAYGTFDWGYGNWFAGIYAISLVDQDGSGPAAYELEIDYYAGYASSWGKLDWTATAIYLQYIDCDADNVQAAFGADRPLECDFIDLWLDGTYPIGEYVTLHGWYAFSPDFEFESGTSHYLWADIQIALGKSGITFHAGAGKWDVEGGTYSESFGGTSDTFGWDYTNTIIGFNTSWKGFDLDLSLHDTNADGPNDNLRNYTIAEYTDDEVVFTISRGF